MRYVTQCLFDLLGGRLLGTSVLTFVHRSVASEL